MTHLPKDMLTLVSALIKEKTVNWFTTSEGYSTYLAIEQQIFNHVNSHCTTEAIARTMLDMHFNRIKTNFNSKFNFIY